MASRASARLKARIENGPTIHPSCNTKSQIITKPSTSRPHKKQKSKAVADSTKEIQPANYARVKGQKGKLKNMLEMPIDILFEVFAKLEPVDLLHLSRATKDLRNMLISPNATFLWKTAYQNLHFPPPICPPGINLRYYTNFLYGQNCHFCGSAYGTIPHYTAHVRLCRICIPKYLKKWNDTVQKGAVKGPSYHSYSRVNRSSITISYSFTVEAIKDDPVALGAFYSERDSPVFNRHEHGDKIKKWWVQERASHAANLEELRIKRTTAIVQKIHAEGYSDELEGLLIRSLPGVNSTKELSDQDWERIKPHLMGILRRRRQEHLEENIVNEFKWRMQQLSNVVNEFYSKTPKPFVIPPTVHFVRAAPFVDLIKNTPIDQKVVDSEIQDLAPHIPDITASWRESADNCLLDLISQISTSRTRKGKGKEISASRLELATTFFKCHWCREPISYPRILMHRCLRHRKLDDSEDEESEDDLVDGDADTKDEEEEEEHADVGEGEGEHLPEQKKFRQHINVDADSVWNKMTSWYGTDWNEGNNQIIFDDEASGFAQVIVKACGEDPDIVTFNHMTKIDARVECLRCSKTKEGQNGKRLVMNWTTAILHDISKHFEEAPDENGWLLISAEDTIEAKDLESKLSTKWRTFHLETSHATTPETGASAYFYLPLDTPMRRPPYAVRI